VFEASATAVIAWSLAALVVAGLVIVAARRRSRAAGESGPGPAGGRGGPARELLLLVAASAVVFAVTGALVATHRTQAWDVSVLRLAARHQRSGAVDLATAVTTLGALPVVLALLAAALLLLLLQRKRRQAAFVLAAALLAMACGGLGKVAFDRPHPKVFSSGHDWSFLTGSGSAWAFPSGHTTAISGLAAALVVVLWPTRWRYPAVALAVLVCAGVGVTRVYLGAHFPTDVIAGWALALAAVGAVRLAFGDPAGA
jgi:undecaprenyl-diphosphatase